MKNHVKRTLAWISLAVPLAFGGCEPCNDCSYVNIVKGEHTYEMVRTKQDGNRVVMFDGDYPESGWVSIDEQKEETDVKKGVPGNGKPDFVRIETPNGRIFKIKGEEKCEREYGGFFRMRKKEITEGHIDECFRIAPRWIEERGIVDMVDETENFYMDSFEIGASKLWKGLLFNVEPGQIVIVYKYSDEDFKAEEHRSCSRVIITNTCAEMQKLIKDAYGRWNALCLEKNFLTIGMKTKEFSYADIGGFGRLETIINGDNIVILDGVAIEAKRVVEKGIKDDGKPDYVLVESKDGKQKEIAGEEAEKLYEGVYRTERDKLIRQYGDQFIKSIVESLRTQIEVLFQSAVLGYPVIIPKEKLTEFEKQVRFQGCNNMYFTCPEGLRYKIVDDNCDGLADGFFVWQNAEDITDKNSRIILYVQDLKDEQIRKLLGNVINPPEKIKEREEAQRQTSYGSR